jgi:hypothetical protein
MTGVLVVLGIVLAIGVAGALYAWLAPRRSAAGRTPAPDRPPLQGDTAWTSAAGDDFSGLSESARCDLIFAVAALDDERSQRLLEHALDDPSEAVSIAAAHALHSRGCNAEVERYLADHPGERAVRIARTLALLSPES